MESFSHVIFQNHATGDFLVSDDNDRVGANPPGIIDGKEVTWEIIRDSDNDFPGKLDVLWKMMELEPGVYKFQSLKTKGYLQYYEPGNRVWADDQTAGAYD